MKQTDETSWSVESIIDYETKKIMIFLLFLSAVDCP